MKKMKKICALVLTAAMLLCGCGGTNTEADEKIASLERELEKEKSKNAKEEKEAEQSSKASESRESSGDSSQASMSSESASSMETQAKDSDADRQSSQGLFGDLFEKNSEYADVNVGDTIRFGHYEQDNNAANGAEEIEWLVLCERSGQDAGDQPVCAGCEAIQHRGYGCDMGGLHAQELAE